MTAPRPEPAPLDELAQRLDDFAALCEEARTITEPSAEYDAWLRQAAGSLGWAVSVGRDAIAIAREARAPLAARMREAVRVVSPETGVGFATGGNQPADPGTLDAAWAEVERALPEGWALWWLEHAPHHNQPEGSWDACAGDRNAKKPTVMAAYGPTPAAALNALAAALARRLTGDPAE